MKRSQPSIAQSRFRAFVPPTVIASGVFLIYWFSNPAPMEHFDYTYRLAEALVHGRLGLTEAPPSWLNEMVPLDGRYYSVFPLGSVLSMVPFALLKSVGVIEVFPARCIASFLAAAAAVFFFLLSGKQQFSLTRRVLLALFPVLATWTWCNLAYAGAWQVALGCALLGEAGALYFTLVKRRPWLAGLCFAIAFGNRTEVVLTAPIFVYLWCRELRSAPTAKRAREPHTTFSKAIRNRIWENRGQLIGFITIPVVLGLATLAYNDARFGSVF